MSKYSNFMLNEMKIKKNGIYYYRNRYCKCGCGGRIPYPVSDFSINHHVYHVIPKFIYGHQNIGRKPSKVCKKKISISLSDRKLSETHKNNIRKSMRGKKLSKAHKNNISKTMSSRTQSPEETMNRALSCMIRWDRKRGKL